MHAPTGYIRLVQCNVPHTRIVDTALQGLQLHKSRWRLDSQFEYAPLNPSVPMVSFLQAACDSLTTSQQYGRGQGDSSSVGLPAYVATLGLCRMIKLRPCQGTLFDVDAQTCREACDAVKLPPAVVLGLHSASTLGSC